MEAVPARAARAHRPAPRKRAKRDAKDRPTAAAAVRAVHSGNTGTSRNVSPSLEAGEAISSPRHSPIRRDSIVTETPGAALVTVAPSYNSGDPPNHPIGATGPHLPPGGQAGQALSSGPDTSGAEATAMSVACLQPARSLGPGRPGVPSTRSRKDGHRFDPYSPYSPSRSYGPRHLDTQPGGSQTQLTYTVPNGHAAHLHSSLPPAYYGTSGENRAGSAHDFPGPARDLRDVKVEPSFPPSSPSADTGPQLQSPYFEQFEQNVFFPPTFSYPVGSNFIHPPAAGQVVPAFNQYGQVFYAGSQPAFHYNPIPYQYSPEFSAQVPMGGGEYYPPGLTPEDTKPSPSQWATPESPLNGQGQGGFTAAKFEEEPEPVVGRRRPEHIDLTDRDAEFTIDVTPTASARNGDGDEPMKQEDNSSSSPSVDSVGRRSSESRPLVLSNNTKRRGPFDARKRHETAETRKAKACVRCRGQKIRCEVGPAGPDGVCKACSAYSKDSKKTIHRIACFRGKLTDVTLYREGGLNLTKRWKGIEMKNVGDREDPNDIRTIKFTQGLCDEPIVIKVVRFRPQEGDVTVRWWTETVDNQEVRKKKELAPYCLADIHTTASEFKQYIERNALPALLRLRRPQATLLGSIPAEMDVVERTYQMAVQHYGELEKNHESETEPVPRELKLMRALFKFWFAARHTTGTAWICGEETLGMSPEKKERSYPLYNKISLPRMILAQFDSINCTRLLDVYGAEVTKNLEHLYLLNQPRWWFTIYLSTFILLREASHVSEDRYKHARRNYGSKIRYSIPAFVEKLQESCNNILGHWHYYNCNSWPDPENPWEERHKLLSAGISSEQFALVKATMEDPQVQRQIGIWNRYKNENGAVDRNANSKNRGPDRYIGSQNLFDWDHRLYWVAQMFEHKWCAHPTYVREEL